MTVNSWPTLSENWLTLVVQVPGFGKDAPARHPPARLAPSSRMEPCATSSPELRGRFGRHGIRLTGMPVLETVRWPPPQHDQPSWRPGCHRPASRSLFLCSSSRTGYPLLTIVTLLVATALGEWAGWTLTCGASQHFVRDFRRHAESAHGGLRRALGDALRTGPPRWHGRGVRDWLHSDNA